MKIICGGQEIAIDPGMKVRLYIDQDDLIDLGMRYSEIIKTGGVAEIRTEGGVVAELWIRETLDPLIWPMEN